MSPRVILPVFSELLVSVMERYIIADNTNTNTLFVLSIVQHKLSSDVV
jgi:hypothetical protein